MYSSKPIQTLDDLKGMKIRTAESETYSQMMQALGGSATPMSMGEVFTAIQSGVVDGAEDGGPDEEAALQAVVMAGAAASRAPRDRFSRVQRHQP